jgi:pimeloyl-ACP methyl ester carboxylesterase/DNA-binding CsgD family transcriptional regulator
MISDQATVDDNGQGHWGLIDRIYETGQSPSAWPLLLDSLYNNFSFDENGSAGGVVAPRSSLQDLWPHFERALSLNSYIDGISSVATANMDFPYPLLVVNEKLNIVYQNTGGIGRFPPQSGIEVDGLKVRTTSVDVANGLSGFFRTTKGSDPERFVAPLCRDERSNNHLVAISLPRESSSNLVALGWLDPVDRGRLTTAHFRQLYDLTDAESKILDHVLRGHETDEVAGVLSIAPGTVRAHLKSIYGKTATAGKSDLIQTVRCGPALLSRFLAPRSEMYDDAEGAEDRRNQTFALSDGRQIGFAEYGAVAGRPILLVHNLIGSRLQLPTNEENLVAQGLRLIVPDRPGVGLSDRHPDGSFLLWCDDIAELADHLELKKVDVVGSSLGAIYGLALAHYQPDRIRRFAMVSCLPQIEDLAAARKLLASTYRLFLLSRIAPPLLKSMMKFIVRKGPEAYMDDLVCELPQLDQRLYDDPAFHRMMLAASRETIRQGTDALCDDVRVMANPWGFSPESIQVPVHYWHGLDDTTAPHSMVLEFAGRIPDCRQHLVDKESHWLLFRQWNAIVAELLR